MERLPKNALNWPILGVFLAVFALPIQGMFRTATLNRINQQASAMQLDEQNQTNAMATNILALPNDVINHKIISHLMDGTLEESTNNIRSLAHSNIKFIKLCNNNSDSIIDRLFQIHEGKSDRFRQLSKFDVAFALRTKSAGDWLTRHNEQAQIALKACFLNAAQLGKANKISYLLTYLPKIVDVTENPSNNDLHTALIHASREGHINIVRHLIKGGANVNHQGYLGITPLHNAAQYGHHEVVRLLLDTGANPSQLNKTKYNHHTPLADALFWNHRNRNNETIRLLRSRMSWMRWIWSWIAAE